MNCASYDFQTAFVLASLSAVVHSPQESEVFVKRSADYLRHSQASSFLEFFQVGDVAGVESDGRGFLDTLHSSHTLPGADTGLDVREHAKVHSIYTCNTNDIRKMSEIPGFVNGFHVSLPNLQTVVESNSLPRRKVSPLEIGRLGQKDLAIRVMDRLREAERREVNLHFASDYRQAWITCSFLQKGLPDAFVLASYACLGIHPDFVWPNIVADRKARLGDEYFTWYTSDDVLRPDVPHFIHPGATGTPTSQAPISGADLTPSAPALPQKGIV